MSEPTFSFGQTLAPARWIEVTTRDGVTIRVAFTDLADPSSYYGGFKKGGLLALGQVTRALSSDDDGSYEGQRWSATVDDTDRTWRTRLGQNDVNARVVVNAKCVLRVIDDAGRRALQQPLTAAIGLMRGYQAE